MHFNGIGSGSVHNSNAHNITNCMYDHNHNKKIGEMPNVSSGSSQTTQQTAGQQEGFSLSAWLEKTLGNGRSLLRAVWGSNETASTGEAGDKSGEAQVLAQIREESAADSISANVTGQDNHQPDTSQMLHTPQIAAASAAVTHPQTVENNPDISVIEGAGSQQDTLWEKMRVKFKDAAGQLTGYLARRFSPGKFAGFQAKNSSQQEKQKEDLRKPGKYRRDVVEIKHSSTEDSYLLDSYDKRGEYSRLSANK